MAITLTDFDKIWASTSPLTPYSFSDANYQQGWNFVGSTPPARQMWDAYMKWSDEKQQYIVQNFLPLSGGTMTGNIISSVSDARYLKTDDSGANSLFSATSWNKGGYVTVWGKDSTNAMAGGFRLGTHDGTNAKNLDGKPDGTLTWSGQPVQTSSDKRLKTDFADVPADILEAWEKVEWKQFKYIADKERKGDSCRFHTGLIAQDVQDACGDKILQYGILCHETTDDGEMWMVRYTEALCMEVAYLRNKLKSLEERIAKLEK